MPACCEDSAKLAMAVFDLLSRDAIKAISFVNRARILGEAFMRISLDALGASDGRR